MKEETLKERANRLSEEGKKIINWIKQQPNSGFYEISHIINPYTGEYIRIYKKGEIRKIYGVFARFEKDKAIFETDKSFLENKNSV